MIKIFCYCTCNFQTFHIEAAGSWLAEESAPFLSFIRIYKNDIYDSDYDYSIFLNEKHNILKTKEATYNEDIA